MSLFNLMIGMGMVVAVVADALWTTLTVSGAGWLSQLTSWPVGRVSMKGPRWVAENAPVLALCATFFNWLVLLWLGWSLVFSGSPDAVLDSKTSTPASFLGRVYYAGYSITTLGVGDLIAGNGAWRITTILAAVSGFVILTLFVTYALALISALNTRRSFGAAVGHLGESPEEVVLLLRDGGSSFLATRLINLTGQLETAASQGDAYPVLEYSHSHDPRHSFAAAAVSLGECALLLKHAIAREDSLPRAVWKPLLEAVDLVVPERHRTQNDGGPLSEPDLDQLRASGLKLASDAATVLQHPQVQQVRRCWQAWFVWHHHHLPKRG